MIPTTPLEYGDPILITKLSKTDGISGAFRCGADGSALFMLYRDDQWQDATGHPRGHIALASAAPDGKLTSIPWQTVPGYKNIDVPKSYFASHDRYYVLTSAEKETAAGTHPVPTRIPLALVFDQTGSLKDVAPLDPTLNPISIAAFGSGDILLVSEDTLNRRMRLSVVDSAGNKLRDIKLEDDDDPSRHHGPNAEGSKGGVTISPHALIGMTEVNPYGQNLLLVPLATSGLPILEIDESHVVRSVVPHLPKGNIIARFIPSDGRTWNIRLGGLNDSVYGQLDADGQANGVGVMESKTLAEVDPEDGHIMRKLDLKVYGTYPVCREQGEFTFLTHGKDAGLELVKAGAK